MLEKKFLTSLLCLVVVLSLSTTVTRGANILFVSSMSADHMVGDDALKAFLEGLGHTVTYLDDNEDEATTEAAAIAADLVFISESCGSGDIKNEITELEVPMIVGEPWAWDEMGLTEGSGGDDPAVTTDVEIIDPEHYMAAGLSGTADVLTDLTSALGECNLGKGITGPEATVIATATLSDGQSYDVIFVYEKGAALPVTPADGSAQVAADIRIGFGFHLYCDPVLNENAYALLGAAVDYALGLALQVDMEIGFATQPPVIDGEVDDIWADASTQYIVRVGEPADASGSWKALYDSENLYVIVDINDESLMNDSASSYLDDSVEFYFDGGNTKDGPPLSGDNRQYTFGWTTDEIQGTNTQTEGVEHAQVDTDTGWRIEIKLPWLSLQDTKPQDRDLIGIDCFYNDDDDDGDTREDQIWTFATDGSAWNDASQWGTAILAAGPLMLDIGNSHNAEELEEGFTSFTLDDSGSDVDGITIEFAGINSGDSRRRDVPSGVPFENIYRDFIFGRQSEPGVGYVSVTLSGLQTDVAYDITLYSWDTYSTGIRIADWIANGELLFTTVHDGNVDPPAAEDDYAYTGTATADANGVILMEAVPGEGTFTDQPFAFINALVVSLAPPTIPFSLGAVGDIELGNDEQVGPDSNSNGSGLGARDIGARRRVALISYDISELKGKGPVSNVSFNNFSHDQHDEVSVYGIIEDLDLLDVESLTWNTAPGVQNDPIPDLGAPVALDPNDLTDILLKFAGPGETGVRFSTDTSQALADFINSDTDGIVTFLLAASAEDYQLIIRSREHSAGGALLEGVQPAPVDPGSDGLVAYYALENDVLDASGNGNDGTIVGNPTVVEGPTGYGMAMEFHGLGAPGGGGDYIDCGNDASLDIPGPLSIALWIKPGADDPEGQGTETAPMAKAMSGVGWSWQVRYGWGSDQPYMAFTFNTSPRAWAYVGRNLERDEWCHIACSHDGTTLKCYLNGEQTDSTPMGQITSSEAPVLIGSDGWGCDWIGAIDEVAIYNRALSDSEIMYLAGN